jgi:hypothetical protein
VAASGWDYKVPYRIHQALWCSRQAQKVKGDFVELGTGRGFTMSAILADFPDWNLDERALHLFDTFKQTLPDQEGNQPDNGQKSPFYATSIRDVRANFSEWDRIYLYEGDLFETLTRIKCNAIAFLHIDMNHPKPEVFGLQTLWPKISRGGVVLLDDYAFANHEEQYDAMNRLSHELNFDILSTPTGQGLIIK